MIRRFGERVRPDKAYRKRPGVYAILPRGGQVLLTHQQAPVPEFQLPGGGIDPGESSLAALHREVLEETGWKIARARRLGAFRRFSYMPDYDLWAEKICTIYLAEPILKLGPPSEPGHTVHWVPEGVAVDALGVEGDRFFLRSLLS